MLLRRTASVLTGLGLALTLGAAPVAAHEGHEEEGNPAQNRDVFTIQCDDAGEITIMVTSAGEKGRGVGRIIEGGKGVVIPVTATFSVRNDTADEEVFSETEVFARGQQKLPTTTCSAVFFTGTVAEILDFDEPFARELLDAGAEETDVITAQVTAQVLLRGPVARSGR